MKKVAVLLIAILLVIGIVWWHETNVIPTVKIPTPVMPKNNGYDTLVSAASSIKDSEKIGYAVGKTPPDKPEGLNRQYSLTEKAALVEKNKGTLVKFQAGMKLPYLNPPARSFDTSYENFAKMRGMARLLSLASQVSAANNQWESAMDYKLDTIEFGGKLARGGALIHMLVGVAVQGIGRSDSWEWVDNLSVTQAKDLAKRLESITSQTVPLSAVYTEEKWFAQAGLLNLMQKPSGLAEAIAVTPEDRSMIKNLSFAMTNKRRLIQQNADFMDELISNAKLPWQARLHKQPKPKSEIDKVLSPVFPRADLAYTKSHAENSLLLGTIALRAYRQSRGQYPTSLKELVETRIIKKVPADPFTTGPLAYKRQGTKYLLYSVGPDGIDNGGKPFPGKDPINNVEAKGDIVAKINQR